MADNDERLSHAEYWDERYAKSNGQSPTHEWFRSFSDLESFFQKFLFQTSGRRPEDHPSIFHLGCGDSVIPAELDARGYDRQTCVDFSATAIQVMADRHRDRPMRWLQMDVRDMVGVESGSVDVAFDKGTLDAMIHGSPWSPPQDVRDNTGAYLGEVARVLKDDGVFLYVTFRQAHFMRPLLDVDGLWEMEMEVLDGGGGFDYYGWILKKAPRKG